MNAVATVRHHPQRNYRGERSQGDCDLRPRWISRFVPIFRPARYGRWLDSRRYRRRQPPNTVHSYPFQPAPLFNLLLTNELHDCDRQPLSW